MVDLTLLSLSGVGVPPYSARGLVQTLDPIPQSSQPRRTINGALIDTSASQMRKFISTITGSDQQPPAVSGVWPGRVVSVDCISELVVQAPDLSDFDPDDYLDRTPVPESVRQESGFIFYRPRLTMRVISFGVSTDEWAAGVGWTMTLEEV